MNEERPEPPAQRTRDINTSGSGSPTAGPAAALRSPPPELLEPKTEATVDALLETVRHLLEEENSRGQSFNTRGVGLAGFVGVVVSLSTTLGHDALAADWGAPWKGIVVGLFTGALASLVGSAVVVVIGVLRPRETATLGMAEVEKYPLPEYIYAPKVMNQGRIMRGLIDALIIERLRAGSQATGLHWSYRLLLVGLACISILGFLLGLHDAKLIGVPHVGRAIQPATAVCTRAARIGCAEGRWITATGQPLFAVLQAEHEHGGKQLQRGR